MTTTVSPTQQQILHMPTDKLLVDGSYQRDLREPFVKKLVRNFDPTRLGVLEVNEREPGLFYVIDGAHRLEALRRLGVEKVACNMHYGLTQGEEAALFIALQRDRQSNNPRERYKAALTSTRPDEVWAHAVKDSLDKVGWAVTKSAAPQGVQAVSALERIYRRGGAPHVTDVVSVLNDAWGGDEGSATRELLLGLSQLLLSHEAIDRKMLARKLKTLNPYDVARWGHAKVGPRGEVHRGFYRVLVEIYNKGLRRNRLIEIDLST